MKIKEDFTPFRSQEIVEELQPFWMLQEATNSKVSNVTFWNDWNWTSVHYNPDLYEILQEISI